MTEPKRRGCLGCSFPIFILIAIVALGIFVLGFLAGPIGSELIGEMEWLSWMSVEAPQPHLQAPELFHVLGLPITNTLIASWITVIFLVVLSWVVTRRMKIVPGRLQVAFEFMLGWIYSLCESIAGEKNGRKFFPVVCTIFLFVLFNAWLSLIPGFGSIEITVNGNHQELLRGANTDINTPMAVALVSFVFVLYFGLKTIGMGFVRQYINFGPFFRSIGQVFRGKFNLMNIFSGAVDIFVGLLELLSMFIRIISFTFRLFGNMTAGEILLLIAAFLIPWVMAVPFYGLELLVGFVQALIFSGLTLVFVTMAVTPHGEEAH
ncbi:MAG: F0F1 ATP synthase subunit A [Dehalococcoidales bacterium]|nr:F0F1 ATP synthase subunit A [Dehalococcoidales bacterium]